MRIYHGAPSPANIRRCREAAPSYTHGACWTPAKMTPHEWPYFVDNGAYGGDFDASEWRCTLDELEKMPYGPDWVVLPDVFNSAAATATRHREHVDAVRDRDLTPAAVLQPGRPVPEQITLAVELGAEVVFVGGDGRWQRRAGEEIVRLAEKADLHAHLGNPGSAERLVWAERVGFDSVDTSSILQNQYFGWLERLEEADDKPPAQQPTLTEATS